MSEVRNDLLDPRLGMGRNRGSALDAVTIEQLPLPEFREA